MIKNIGALVLGLAAACGPAAAVEPWALYDDFSSTFLNPAKWPATGQERRRVVEGNIARLLQRDLGRTDIDSGRNGASFGNSLTRGTAVTQMRSYVRINAIEMSACSAPSVNTTPTRVRARTHGGLGAAADQAHQLVCFATDGRNGQQARTAGRACRDRT